MHSKWALNRGHFSFTDVKAGGLLRNRKIERKNLWRKITRACAKITELLESTEILYPSISKVFLKTLQRGCWNSETLETKNSYKLNNEEKSKSRIVTRGAANHLQIKLTKLKKIWWKKNSEKIFSSQFAFSPCSHPPVFFVSFISARSFSINPRAQTRLGTANKFIIQYWHGELSASPSTL